jgi:DNA-3-methyladenine glycosylase
MVGASGSDGRAWEEAIRASGDGSLRDAEPLIAAFFARDTRHVAHDLLGKLLLSRIDGMLSGGRIVETEAYLGSDDEGSHAATRGVTERNRVMYGPPGCAYVYFTYGMHHMLNLVCEPQGTAGAVLVRGLEPLVGLEVMIRRRGGRAGADVSNGPAKVAQALGVDLRHDGAVLGEDDLVVYDAPVPPETVAVSGRIGLSAGHEHEYRFYLKENRFVSRSRPGARPPRRRTREGS